MTEKDLLTVFQKFGLANQPTTAEELDVVTEIAFNAAETDVPVGYVVAIAALSAYKLGVINGKRAERARRKKAAIGAGTPTAAVDTTQGSECVKGEYSTMTQGMKGASE